MPLVRPHDVRSRRRALALTLISTLAMLLTVAGAGACLGTGWASRGLEGWGRQWRYSLAAADGSIAFSARRDVSLSRPAVTRREAAGFLWHTVADQGWSGRGAGAAGHGLILWSVGVPSWLASAGGLALGAWAVLGWRRWRRDRRRLHERCPACGYDLRASAGACPECGEPATSGGEGLRVAGRGTA